jgi:hypothetical protein
MALGAFGASSQVEARLSYLEQIIIIIIIGGGGFGFPPRPPIGDSFTSDITRLDALSRLVGRARPGDVSTSDLPRLSATEIEGAVHEINAEIVRLRSLENLMNTRLKELRGPENAPKT